MIIECERCEVRGLACASCAIGAALVRQSPASQSSGRVAPGLDHADLDHAEIRALTVLANAGLIPPLRYARRLLKAS
jgi:hypothetical protein